MRYGTIIYLSVKWIAKTVSRS